ncbi:MAG TPA: redoxin domain-containing protein [Candidatus Acidoferrales bacterium]|nr:redoxin domain-containing protein [Candidatus Acidoferrales bacterium]
MKINIYILVFGIIAAIVIVAAASTLFFNQAPQQVMTSNLPNYGPAPNVQGIAYWINSPPLNLTQLKGKVVLIDFWTYSCINCIRTTPYLNAWWSKYGNNGLVIIGVSTPEFQFEHNYTNVQSAVTRFGIRYPVAMDNNYSTWFAYNNQYWPADYIIDASGNVRYVHFGEGDYANTENVIQTLLQQAGYKVNTTDVNVTEAVNFSGIQSPELYFGYQTSKEHGTLIGDKQGYGTNKTINYTTQNVTVNNTAYLEGSWYNAPDGMISVNGSRLLLNYNAKNVNIVAGPSGINSTTITVKVDGQNLTTANAGSDIPLTNGVGTATINSARLYNIVAGQSYGHHMLEIDAAPGMKIYTFTFG